MLDFSLIGYTDVRNIISDDDSLQEGVLPALEEYNLTQFTVADVPGADHQVCPLNISRHSFSCPRAQSIVSEAAKFPSNSGEDRFLDPRSKTSFLFDHLSLVSRRTMTGQELS